MIPNATLILGPPGTGKTYTLMKHIEDAFEKGISPDRIGFVSFTKKAIEEAVDRACSQFKLNRKQLPWFRTLHSWGFNGISATSDMMMGAEDWKIIENNTGYVFEGFADPDDGVLVNSARRHDGDKYIRIIDKSRLRLIPLEQEFNETHDWSLSLSACRQIKNEIESYKSAFKKIDFVDQLELYIQTCTPPHLELLIVDEAQDLTPLQWKMVRLIALSADRVIVAGDDDQAIHRWTGVDVQEFMQCADSIVVLKQSYRMPQSIHNVSQNLVRQIRNRMDKDFLPMDNEGSVDRAWSLDIDLSQGSWTLMARTNFLAREWAKRLRTQQYLFSLKGRSSVDQKLAMVLNIWRRLQQGEAVEVGLIREMYKNVRKIGDDKVVKKNSTVLLDAAPLDGFLTYEDLVMQYGLVAEKERNAFQVARFGEQDRRYIESIELRGEDITKPPRLKVSTFHAMKGGEDDNIAVWTGSSKLCEVNNPHYDDEHRAFYVGVTRAKNHLTVVTTPMKYKYRYLHV